LWIFLPTKYTKLNVQLIKTTSQYYNNIHVDANDKRVVAKGNDLQRGAVVRGQLLLYDVAQALPHAHQRPRMLEPWSYPSTHALKQERGHCWLSYLWIVETIWEQGRKLLPYVRIKTLLFIVFINLHLINILTIWHIDRTPEMLSDTPNKCGKALYVKYYKGA